MEPTLVIETKGLTKRYGSQVALRSLDLVVEPGEIFGYLGPNGAGKTTTIRLLLGLATPTAGSIRLFGLDPKRDRGAVHRRLASVPGDPALWPRLTGLETLELLGAVHGRVDFAFRRELLERFELDPSKRVVDYSRGNRQKVVLIAALQGRPDLLLLDEPTSGLDPLKEQVFREVVTEARAAGQTVLLSSHQLSEVEALCDRVGILRRGELIDQGSLSELRQLAATEVAVEFSGELASLDGVPGVVVRRWSPGRVELSVHGAIQPLLEALSGVAVTKLSSRPASLEELFLTRYGEP